MKKNNNKGFTLMEMLIVVAIIAVLVAIAIPVFTNQLEKSREATDAANIRSAYAEVMACALTGETAEEAKKNDVKVTVDAATGNTYSKTVKAVQKQTGWQNKTITDIAGIEVSDTTSTDAKNTITAGKKDTSWTITYTEQTNKCTIVEN